LIALSSHGRSGFRRLVMGSVAEAVLRHARVPVLVFPRQE
jgi:nucleotide-binding universal stress UspA family protein